MIAGRFLAREIWERKLRRLGSEPLQGKGLLNTAEWWRDREWRPFTVPIEDDGSCEFWAVQRVCAQLGDTLFGSLFDPEAD